MTPEQPRAISPKVITQEFIDGRKEAFAEIKAMIKHDHDRHAPHGVWNLAGPVDQPVEIDRLAFAYGEEVVANVREAVDALAEGYSLQQVTAKMHIDTYTPPTGETATEGRLSAIADMRYLLAMMNLQGLAAKTVSTKGHEITQENMEASRVALNNYAMGMMSNFITDLRNMDIATRKTLPAPKDQPKKPKKARQKPSLRRVWNYMMAPAGSKPATGTTTGDLFRDLPKSWPPVHRTVTEEPAFAAPTSVAAAQAAQTVPDTASETGTAFNEGVLTGMRSIFYGLQRFHFQSLSQDGYVPIMPKDEALARRAVSLSRELFDTVRLEIQAHINDAPETPEQAAGSYEDGLRHAATLTREILTGLEHHPKIQDDKQLNRYAYKLANHWSAHTDTLIQQTINGKGPELPTRRARRNMMSRPS